MKDARQGQPVRRSRLLILAGAALVASAVGVPAPAAAQPPTAETVTVVWSPTSESTAPPYLGTGAGTFSASGAISDSGTAAFAGQDVAVPSPIIGIYQGSFTLTGQAGTLTLRCHDESTDYSDPAAVPGTGTCAITDGTGTYEDIHGQGTLSSITNFVTLTEDVTFSLTIV